MRQGQVLRWTVVVAIGWLLGSAVLATEKKPKKVRLDDFEGAVSQRWQNMTASTNHAKQGKTSGRWTAQVDAANLKVPHDWSAWAKWNLTFWCYSEKATQARFLVMLASDSDHGPGPDFFYFPITVDWTGWKAFRVPLDAFKTWDHPVGLKQVDAVVFSISLDWAGASLAPNTVLYFDELALME